MPLPAAASHPAGTRKSFNSLAKALAGLAGMATFLFLLANFYAASQIPKCPHIPTLVNCTNKAYPVLGGADVVSFFSRADGTPPARGKPAYRHVHLGYTYYFHNSENMRRFAESPSRFIPRNGGFCSWGISNEFEPEFVWARDCLGPAVSLNAWIIRNDRLYLFLADTPEEKFEKNLSENEKKGDRRYLAWFPEQGFKMNTTCVFEDHRRLDIEIPP
ncbi:hypothetical protein VB716_00170 [Synechococcus sp. CCY9201]|uniref:hypothetical protein n=1 Tax=unclassified Synechococcus TaxID=2626047 RepID=UPI0018CE2565|nr:MULTISPECIES: hypothetical protein [unclassified Synechococcus]MEA5472637.1 hypothetical protein [Synechococcus sp. CCY9201]QPN67643.1 hypothetical protein H8F26_05595 [Synechococcus sp. CBW1006]